MRRMCEDAVSEAEVNAEFSVDFRPPLAQEVGAYALLMAMPERTSASR
jgi:hypothetical protein